MSPIGPRRSPVSLFALLLFAGVAFVATGCFTPSWYPGGYGRGYGYGGGGYGGGGCGYGCGYGSGYYNRPYYNYGKPYYRYGYGGKGHHHDHDDDDDDHHGRRYEPYRGPSNGPSNGPPATTRKPRVVHDDDFEDRDESFTERRTNEAMRGNGGRRR